MCKRLPFNDEPEQQVKDLDKLFAPEELEAKFWEVRNGGRDPTCYMRLICPFQNRIYTHAITLDVIIISRRV